MGQNPKKSGQKSFESFESSKRSQSKIVQLSKFIELSNIISKASNCAINKNLCKKDFVKKWTLQFYLTHFMVLVLNQSLISAVFHNSAVPISPNISTNRGPVACSMLCKVNSVQIFGEMLASHVKSCYSNLLYCQLLLTSLQQTFQPVKKTFKRHSLFSSPFLGIKVYQKCGPVTMLF